MSRARREKEQEINWKVLIPIICVIVVIIVFFVVRNVQNKGKGNEIENTANSEDELQNIENELTDEENFVEENTIEGSDENGENNTTENNVANEEPEPDVTINESSAPARPGITDQKQKAIELVKKEWGQDDTVNFAFDYVNENGEYVIAVKDNTTTAVKNYFRVNLEKGTVELD